MNRQSKKRIRIAKKIIKPFIEEYKDEILTAFITGDVANGTAKRYSKLEIHVIYKNEQKRYELNSELTGNVSVEWTFKPIEMVNDLELIKSDHNLTFSIYNSISLYDKDEWLKKTKEALEPYIFNEESIIKRVSNLWGKIEELYDEIESVNKLEEFIELYKMLLYPTLLLPITKEALLTDKINILIQTKKALKKMGHKDVYESFLNIIGCTDFTKKDVLFYFNNLMSMYDHCIEVQVEDYHGINQINRNYIYKSIKHLIKNGYYKEAVYPILDLMWLIDFRITTDTGADFGWWTMMVKALEKRLDLTKTLYKKRKRAFLKMKGFIQKEIINE